MLAAFATLLTNRWVLGLLGVGLMVAAIGIQTARLNHAKGDLQTVRTQLASLKAQEAAAAAHAAQVARTQAGIGKAVSGHQAAIQTHIVTVTKTLIQQVPYAVPPPVDVFLNNGWVRVADASALGMSPAPATSGKPDDAPSAVKTSDALRWVIDNNGTCHENAAELTDLQSWVQQVTAAQ